MVLWRSTINTESKETVNQSSIDPLPIGLNHTSRAHRPTGDRDRVCRSYSKPCDRRSPGPRPWDRHPGSVRIHPMTTGASATVRQRLGDGLVMVRVVDRTERPQPSAARETPPRACLQGGTAPAGQWRAAHPAQSAAHAGPPNADSARRSRPPSQAALPLRRCGAGGPGRCPSGSGTACRVAQRPPNQPWKVDEDLGEGLSGRGRPQQGIRDIPVDNHQHNYRAAMV